jgi:voltage-gated potassium channel
MMTILSLASRPEAMSFAGQTSAAAVLVALTLTFHSAGMAALIYWVKTDLEHGMYRFGPFRSGVLMVRFTSVIIGLHLLQVLLWAGFYRWNCFASWESAFYFSAASYSTVGYGDLLLPRMWRILGPLESVIGVLMCGLSAAFLFAIVTRLVEREARFARVSRPARDRPFMRAERAEHEPEERKRK